MTIRITWARLLGAVLALALLGLAAGWSGAINVAASSGHWRITEWFLHWVMRNSVATHSYWQAPEQTGDATGLVSAAGHFAGSCAVCHGAPGIAASPVLKAAMPPAPDLAVNAGAWKDRELFWILEHGVKYSGMPAWPAKGRDDEVRRMAAFVRQLPGMTPATYRALTGGAAGVAGSDRFAACAGCHGTDGRGRGQPDIPVLGGQDPAYLLAALHAYRTGTRPSAVMANAVARLNEADMRAFALRFAAMPGLSPVSVGSRDAAAARIVTAGLPAAQLPACAGCHAPGKPYPVLAGQKAVYLAGRLQRWQGDEAVVDARKPHDTMPVIARRIPEAMIDRLARFYAAARR